MHSISCTEGRGMFLLAKYSGSFSITDNLNIPSISKLENALSLVDDPTVTFKYFGNRLEYKGDNIKFKYHLYEDGSLIPLKISKEKIEGLEFDCEFDVEVKFIRELLKTSSVFNSTNKLYINTSDDGELVFTLGDKTLTNTDSYSINRGVVDFFLDDFIILLDDLRCVDFLNQPTIKMQINSRAGIGSLLVEAGTVSLNYVISSLVK